MATMRGGWGVRLLSWSGWFGVGVLLSWLAVGLAYAGADETIPATVGTGSVAPVNYSCYSGMPPADKRTNQAAAEYWCLQYFVGESNAALRTRDSRESRPYGYMLNWKYTSGASGLAGVGMTYNCAAGQTKVYAATGDLLCSGGTVYSCPAGEGWTLSGTTCTREACDIDESRIGGVCKTDCGKRKTSGNWSARDVSGSGPIPDLICYDGCYHDGAGLGVGTSSGWVWRTGAPTGSPCTANAVDSSGAAPAVPDTPDRDATPTESGCKAKGEGFATMGGVTVCLPPTDKKTTGKESVTTTAADGTKTTVTTTTQETCTGAGACTTTSSSSTVVTPPGGSPGAPTTATGAEVTTDETSFCEAHPNDAKCKGESDQGEFCAEHPDAVGCKDLGTPSDGEALGTKAAGVSSVTAVTVPTNMSCPSDITLPHGAVFSWVPICDFAGWLRPVVLAMAWLGAGLLVIGGLRNG